MSSNNRNRGWAGGVGMATGAALAAALIGLANAPAADAEGSAVDTAVDNFLQGIANSFAPEVLEGTWGDPDALCLTLLTCTEPPGDQMIDAFYQAVNMAFQPEGPIDGYFDQLFGAAATSGVASADSYTDPFSWIGGMDLGDLSVPAQTSALDIQASISGFFLFPTAGNTAFADAGIGDIAIAIGNGAQAIAGDPYFLVFQPGDFAFADGTNSTAEAGLNGSFDSATVIGANSTAEAGGMQTPGLFDLAAAFGDMLHASALGNFLVDIPPLPLF